MTAAPYPFIIAGGLDQETPTLAIQPGRAIACLNHECAPDGYKRTQGFERFSGKPSPAAYELMIGEFTDSVSSLAGEIVTGATSGATCRIVAVTVESGDPDDGDAAGTFCADDIDGEFVQAEYLMVDDIAVARLSQPPFQRDRMETAATLAYWRTATAARRAAILKPEGSGPVRGVLWYDGALYAWRDKVDVSAGRVHKATPNGWTVVDFGSSLAFSGGGPLELIAGSVITGSTSGATATVRSVALDAGTDWAEGDATGSLVLDNVTGTFVEDELLDSAPALGVATVTAFTGPTTIPAGGRYEFVVHNFYGSVGFGRAYGVNGTGPAFEFDGSNLFFISTGMPDDRPFLIAEHKKHLFLGFPKGSLQNSALGEPRSFNAILGAAEFGMGKELTNLIPNTADSMIVMTDGSMSALTGNDVSDFLLQTVSEDAGAKRFTAQSIGSVVYMDNRGLRKAAAAQNYGNFNLGTFSTQISKTLDKKRELGAKPCASMVIKAKDQYLIFFDDRTGISFYMGRKNPEAMIFEYPFVVTCCHVAEVDGKERIFVGADDGHVYELNVGPSFDGQAIEAMVQLAYGNQRAPRVNKRYHKIALDVEATPGVQISILAQFDNAGDLQPYPHAENIALTGGGGIWGVSDWADFYWDAPDVARAETSNPGSGENISPIIVSISDFMDGYTLQSATILWSQRGMKR
ncbi:hypothetical protein [Sphingobium yanoikuyae]|uniref:hypothetical protein n=1 Tax=Sphingobium yanoikuyae TaxID=13690 RepID=UPI0035C760CB